MRCERCGSEIPESSKFCTRCGAPLAGRPPGYPPGAAGPGASTVPPHPPSPTSSRRGGLPRWLLATIVVSAVVVAGASSGIVIWLVSSGSGPAAEISKLELLDSSGKAVDTEEASLEEMTLKVTYYVDFGKGANGKLETAILDGEGEEVFKDLERLEPGGETQEYEYGFHLQESAGEKFKARVSISVEDGGREVTDARRLGFYVEEGMSEDREFEQSKEAALARIDEAATMIADLAGVGVEVTDLAERVALAAGELETATTVEEATQVYEAADSVIQECDARKAAHEEAVRAAEREQNIAAARQSMFDYAYAGKGNCEDIWWVDFQINEEGNRATGTLQGMVTAHTDPDRAGQRTNFYLEAEKEGGAWVVTGYSYEHIP